MNNNLMLKPDYGPQVMLTQPCKYVIRDYGDNLRSEEIGDILVIVAQTTPWKLMSTIQQCKDYLKSYHHTETKVVFVANSLNEEICKRLWNSLGVIGISMPYIENVFCLDGLVENHMRELCVALNIIEQGGEKDKKKAGLFRRISKVK